MLIHLHKVVDYAINLVYLYRHSNMKIKIHYLFVILIIFCKIQILKYLLLIAQLIIENDKNI